MSNLLANYKLLKRICEENKSASDAQETNVNTVNLKGELLVGDGSGPSQLDPSTGSDGDLLCLNSGAPQGVQWETIPPLLPLVQGGYHLYDEMSGVILPEWHNYYVEVTSLLVATHTLFLPPVSGLPNGFTVWIFANTVTPGGVFVNVNSNDSTISTGGTISNSISYPNLSIVAEFDKYVYDLEQNRWHRRPMSDYTP
jgi:hypothetical protein